MPSQFEAVAGSALGYSDDDTGSVTQATNKGTGVTLNKPSGVITMNDAALGAAENVTFSAPEGEIAKFTNTEILARTAWLNATLGNA